MIEDNSGLGFRGQETLHRRQEHGTQSFWSHARQQIGGEIGKRILKSAWSRCTLGRNAHTSLDLARRFFEGSILEQLGEQQVSFFEQRQFLIEVESLSIRQQSTQLQLDERCGNQQKLGCDVKVERFHLFEFDEVRVDDGRQADLIQIDLVSRDQVEEQIKGPLEHRGTDGVRHEVTL